MKKIQIEEHLFNFLSEKKYTLSFENTNIELRFEKNTIEKIIEYFEPFFIYLNDQKQDDFIKFTYGYLTYGKFQFLNDLILAYNDKNNESKITFVKNQKESKNEELLMDSLDFIIVKFEDFIYDMIEKESIFKLFKNSDFNLNTINIKIQKLKDNIYDANDCFIKEIVYFLFSYFYSLFEDHDFKIVHMNYKI